MKDIAKLKSGLRLAQEKKGYSFNRNTPFVDRIIESLAANLERYGYMACPCRLATGERETDRPIICPCEYRDEDVRDHGVCYCGLFVSTKNKDKDFNSVNVPERHVYKD